mmetsp:Transcript_55/g.98  ORF Transcript_55/g.98 Transcript_55/m.98 type:complete len:490 (+) Transcript_55:153-1622(+)
MSEGRRQSQRKHHGGKARKSKPNEFAEEIPPDDNVLGAETNAITATPTRYTRKKKKGTSDAFEVPCNSPTEISSSSQPHVVHSKLTHAPTLAPEPRDNSLPGDTARLLISILGEDAPGAVFVPGPGISGLDPHQNFQPVDDVTAPGRESSASGGYLVSATLVKDGPSENAGADANGSSPVIVARKQTLLYLLSDRRVQVVIICVLLLAAGIILWAFLRQPSSKSTPLASSPSFQPSFRTPSPSPTSMPSLTPGTLVANFCVLDPIIQYGGDFCPITIGCVSCPSSEDTSIATAEVCFDPQLPNSLLQLYCRQLNTTVPTRPCGTVPECPAENYCVDCASYAPLNTMTGALCVDEDRSVGDGSGVYSRCVRLNAEPGQLIPCVLTMELDENPTETGWDLLCGGRTIRSVPSGTYTVPNAKDFEAFVEIPFLTECTLRVTDTGGDGVSTGLRAEIKIQHTEDTREAALSNYVPFFSTSTTFSLVRPSEDPY